MQFRLDSKTILNLASVLKANKLNTNADQLANTLMKFDNLILNDLLTGVYRFIPSLLNLIFDFDSIHYIA